MAFQELFDAFVRLAFSPGQLGWRRRRSPSQPHTTRIETRPYYGAVVTIEHGVRVYRPVPPTQHLIINPDGTTPLQLNIGAGGSASSRTPRPRRGRPLRQARQRA